jgi:hypothetical protein
VNIIWKHISPGVNIIWKHLTETLELKYMK